MCRPWKKRYLQNLAARKLGSGGIEPPTQDYDAGVLAAHVAGNYAAVLRQEGGPK